MCKRFWKDDITLRRCCFLPLHVSLPFCLSYHLWHLPAVCLYNADIFWQSFSEPRTPPPLKLRLMLQSSHRWVCPLQRPWRPDFDSSRCSDDLPWSGAGQIFTVDLIFNIAAWSEIWADLSDAPNCDIWEAGERLVLDSFIRGLLCHIKESAWSIRALMKASFCSQVITPGVIECAVFVSILPSDDISRTFWNPV